MKLRSQLIGELERAKVVLTDVYPIKTLAVFGSVSRGDDTEESDIDILVEFSQPVGIAFIRLARDLERILNRKVDLVSRGGIKEKYFRSIQSDLIYV
jgi:predicted nucleotidyltransferase